MSKLRVMVPRKDKARTNLHTSTAGSQGQRCAPSVADSDSLWWKWCCTPALLAVQQPLKFWFLDRSCEHSSRERGFRAKSLKHFVGDYSRVTSTGLDNGLMMGNQNCRVTVLQLVLHQHSLQYSNLYVGCDAMQCATT